LSTAVDRLRHRAQRRDRGEEPARGPRRVRGL